ncbi:glycoside hydrolase 5 family protein [Phytoactinopolyspora halotolerans]|uniref:Cellulase family glycosylhydrolase n=1 Tax=Phytoactinopolyspora halotolerans TaxID=1981512 RepID=A0A6L9S2Y9_9ACTN|nr:cellulase family glycosylhydrolase [Phytoactinopolyspora halotolerans]NED99422.1 cellulase family glycosylhydrolase [Phytoactinopolyspora halotolerans]
MRRQAAKVETAQGPQAWLGVNYWSRTGGPHMWRHYDAQIVREELATMREHGMTVTRSFFFWPDFMPTPHTLDQTMVDRYADFLDRHAELGMQTIPTFIVGHMSGQNWDPAWRDGRDIFGDVWFVARQAWYVRELTTRFAAHPSIAAWLLTNEIPIYGDRRSRGIGTLDAEAVTSWAQLLIDAVRAGGGTQPVSIGDGAWGREITGTDNGFRVRDLSELVDFHGPHVYRMETDLVRQHLGAAFICELLDIGGKPVVMEEFGLTSDYVSEENAAHYYRQILHNTLLAGATGWITWNNTDYDAQFDVEPYVHHPFEMHFGLTDHHGVPKKQALEVKKFASVLERIDVTRTYRPDAEAALVVSSYLEADYPFTQPADATAVVANARQGYIAAREADLPVRVTRELDGLPEDGKLYIVPCAKQLLAPTWRQLVRLAEGGAVVYASYFVGDHSYQRGPWWPDLDTTFGVRKQLTYGLVDPIVDDEVTMTFQQTFGAIAPGDRLTFRVAGTENSRAYLPVVPTDADVVATDAHGRPALLRRRAGGGALVLSTYPLEHMAAGSARVNPEPTHRIYAALCDEAGVRRDVRVHDPRIHVGRLIHEDGRQWVWLVSQSSEEITIEPVLTAGVLTDDDGQVSTVRLAPYDVRVLELRV